MGIPSLVGRAFGLRSNGCPFTITADRAHVRCSNGISHFSNGNYIKTKVFFLCSPSIVIGDKAPSPPSCYRRVAAVTSTILPDECASPLCLKRECEANTITKVVGNDVPGKLVLTARRAVSAQFVRYKSSFSYN